MQARLSKSALQATGVVITRYAGQNDLPHTYTTYNIVPILQNHEKNGRLCSICRFFGIYALPSALLR